MEKKQILQDSLKLIESSSKKIRDFMNGIVDEGSFVETDVFLSGKSFIDGAEAPGEGVVTGYATVNGNPVHIFAQNQEVLKGSLGLAHAEKILKCMNKAMDTGTPLISVIDSSGARIGDGVELLEGYAKIIKGASEVADSVPHICIVKGNCVGMMTSVVNMADFVFMSADAVMSVNSPAALASEAKDFPKFNKILGYNNYKDNSDVAHFTYKNASDLSAKLTELLDYVVLTETSEEDDPNREAEILNSDRSASNVIKEIVDGGKSIEFASDFAKEIKCVLAKINGLPVGILATDGAENDGFISCKGLKKATDFVNKLEALDLPLITLVDSKGVKSCLECEVKGFSQKATALLAAIADSCVKKIAVVTGKAIGYAYTALASKAIGFDYSLAFDGAEISPVTSESAVNIVYADELKKAKDPIKTREKLARKYAELKSDPMIAAKQGFIDNVIVPQTARPYIASALLMLLGL